MEKDKIIWLDGLRGVACAIVVIAHMISFNPSWGAYASGCGKIGVWLFFLMSGLLLIYHAKNRFTSINTLLLYYWKKALRLYPIYLVGLVVALFCGMLASPISIIKHIFLIEGVGHFWYMSVIIRFYLIAPIFEWIYLKSKRVFVSVVIVLAVSVAILLPYNIYPENSIWLIWYIPVFAMGMLMCVGLEWTKNWKDGCYWDMLVLLGVVFIVMLTPLGRQILWNIEPSGFLQNKYLLLGGIWCMILFSISKSVWVKKWLIEAKLLKFIGQISYSVYVLHFSVMYGLVSHNVNWGLAVLITLVVSVCGGAALEERYRC